MAKEKKIKVIKEGEETEEIIVERREETVEEKNERLGG
jgi:hypothetical protein